MLVFQGEFSNNCKRYMIKKLKSISIIGLVIPCFLLCIPMLILTFIYHWSFVLAVITLLLLPLLGLIQPKSKSLDLIVPFKVSIDTKTNCITSKGKNFYFERKTSQIKKIIDYGEWYHIYFVFPHKNQSFICQKDLLVQGTIEEFKNYFQDKIIVKNKG